MKMQYTECSAYIRILHFLFFRECRGIP